VERFITDRFIPARLHVKEQASDYKRFAERYEAQWTPTILELDPDGNERHRIQGFLPVDDFLAQLTLGLGHAAFKREDWVEAERAFRAVVTEHPDAEAAAEALYWAGVARYKGSKDPAALAETASAFADRYTETSWAKKASVWKK
jgi:uncharacterized protein HemY